jgi:hypothetical protein
MKSLHFVPAATFWNRSFDGKSIMFTLNAPSARLVRCRWKSFNALLTFLKIFFFEMHEESQRGREREFDG